MHFMSFRFERGTESKTLIVTKTLKLCKYLHLRASFGYFINKKKQFFLLSLFLLGDGGASSLIEFHRGHPELQAPVYKTSQFGQN